MLKFLVFTLLSVSSLLATAAAADTVQLNDLTPADEQMLRQRLPSLFSGNKIELSVLDEAIRLLMAQGTYENVYIDRKNSSLFEITGKPLRLVEEIKIEGEDHVSASALRELLEIKVGDRFDRKKAVQAAEKIKTYYSEQGYFSAIIELNFAKMESKNIRLEFTIQEKEPCLIKGIVFQTSNTDLLARLNSRFRGQLKRVLTVDRARRLMNGLNEFLIDKGYLATEVIGPDVRYNDARTEAYLKYEIREPYRWETYFTGYKFLSRGDVSRALDIDNPERKNVDPAGEGAERIRRAYLEAGFPNVRIETRVVNPKDTYLKRVYYDIDEGARVKIQAIEIQGRITRPSSYYQNFILNNSSDLVRQGYYNRLELENGFKNMVTELRNQGHLRARTLSSRVEYSDKKDRATVYLLLEEGPQTQIRALDFEGNRFFSSFELAKVTGLETNSPLKLNAFEESIEKLKAFYYRQGFLEMRLLNEGENLIEYNDRGTQARVIFRIYEGPRIRVHRIVVEGNTFTKSRVILKEADFKTSEVLTPAKVEEAMVRLNKLNLFSRVDIRTLEENSNIAERTLVISVTERDPGIFRLGAGVNNERNLTVRGFTGVGYNNLWGTGRAVSTRAEVQYNVSQVKYPEYEVTAGYLEPFVFDTRTRGRVNVTRSERVAEFETATDQNIELTRLVTSNRIDFLAERDLTRYTKLTWKTWSLESRREFERNGRCLPDGDLKLYEENDGFCPPKTLQIATIGPTLDIDYRDNPFLPTRGTFTRFVIDYSQPQLGSSSGVHFFRIDSNFTHYTRLGSPRFVWANSLRGGHVKNLSGETDSGVPTSYAFLLGGIYTVRGFDMTVRNERIPKDNNDGFTVASENTKLIENHSQYFLIKTELRFPISGDHGGVLFYDGGAVFIAGYDFKRPYRDAVGMGYRYNTPVGPLALDLAFKINPERDEDPREDILRVHLSIGTF